MNNESKINEYKRRSYYKLSKESYDQSIRFDRNMELNCGSSPGPTGINFTWEVRGMVCSANFTGKSVTLVVSQNVDDEEDTILEFDDEQQLLNSAFCKY